MECAANNDSTVELGRLSLPHNQNDNSQEVNGKEGLQEQFSRPSSSSSSLSFSSSQSASTSTTGLKDDINSQESGNQNQAGGAKKKQGEGSDTHNNSLSGKGGASAENSKRNRPSRKRRRVVLPAAQPPKPPPRGGPQQLAHQYNNAATMSVIKSPNDNSSTGDWHHHSVRDEPDLSHCRQMLAALLLTTSLGALSAMDAKEQCLRHETNALLDLVDDDNFQKAYNTALVSEDNKCVHMFRYVLLPTLGVTLGLGFVALLLLYLYSRNQSTQQQNASAAIAISCPSQAIRLTGELFLLSIGILGVQTYNIMAVVMLRPRLAASAGDQQDDNPYQTLAAVDRYGSVGENANLYYLTWASMCLALALFYQLGTAFVRLFRTSHHHHYDHQSHSKLHRFGTNSTQRHEALLPVPSWDNTDESNDESEQESRAMWFQSIYRLRFRTGIWVAALLSCLVIVASSHVVWTQVVWPIAQQYYTRSQQGQGQNDDNDDDVEANGNEDDEYDAQNDQDETQVSTNLYHMQICEIVGDAGASPQLCRRTVAAWLSGLIASGLCATAIGMHLFARHSASRRHGELKKQELQRNYFFRTASPIMWEKVFAEHRLPLRTELVLSVLLSLLLGFNAFFCTSVQGPAAKVGNLFYSSWLSFLLVVRICLGCLEEAYNISDNEHPNPATADTSKSTVAMTAHPYHQHATHESPKIQSPYYRNMQSMVSHDPSEHSAMMDIFERNRVKRIRTYFFLFIFSGVCAASAYDAASTQNNNNLSRGQSYMILSPCIVATLSAFLFALCLSKRCYIIVSHFMVGGVLSVICFGLWLVDLVLTMHSGDSWAVDGIGEILNGTMYYYSWAGILTAGLQMMSYIKSLSFVSSTALSEDYMSMVWVAICKICFVILGAALHVWHTISGNCGFDEITYGAVTFCSRTVLAIAVALAGMLVGSCVILGRMFLLYCSKCHTTFMIRLQAHVEMLISMFLVLLFGAAVALITGIGGPGQSVGDLYYSTWLAFVISLGIFITCESQVRNQQQLPSTPPYSSTVNDPTLMTSTNNGKIPMLKQSNSGDTKQLRILPPDSVLV